MGDTPLQEICKSTSSVTGKSTITWLFFSNFKLIIGRKCHRRVDVMSENGYQIKVLV